jgi:uncharacterized membrane protein
MPEDTDDPDYSQDVAEATEDDASAFVTMVTHFYRAEMDRITTWRNRMDQTTNWAVVVMAAILTWSFSSRSNPHYVLLLGALAIGVFLLIEVKRFQEYDAWRSRIRVLQTSFFAEGLDAGDETQAWRERLAADLRNPVIEMSMVAAFGHRLKHVYFPLLTVMLAAWALRVTVFLPDQPWQRTATVAVVPGEVLVAVVGAGYLTLGVLTAWSLPRSFRQEFDYEADFGEEREQ